MSIIENGTAAAIVRNRIEDKNTLQNKGQIYAGTGESEQILNETVYKTAAVAAPDANDKILVSDSTTETGLAWKSATDVLSGGGGTVDNAKNVTDSIGGVSLSNIFVGNTPTVQNASYASNAGTATNATYAASAGNATNATNATTATNATYTSFTKNTFKTGTTSVTPSDTAAKFYYIVTRNTNLRGGAIIPKNFTKFLIPCLYNNDTMAFVIINHLINTFSVSAAFSLNGQTIDIDDIKISIQAIN